MVRRSGQLAAIAGALWLILWAHQAVTHDLTAVNERRLFFGMTWMDSGKFYVLPFVLLLISVVGLSRARQNPGKLGRAGFVFTVLALLLILVGSRRETSRTGSRCLRAAAMNVDGPSACRLRSAVTTNPAPAGGEGHG